MPKYYFPNSFFTPSAMSRMYHFFNRQIYVANLSTEYLLCSDIVLPRQTTYYPWLSLPPFLLFQEADSQFSTTGHLLKHSVWSQLVIIFSSSCDYSISSEAIAFSNWWHALAMHRDDSGMVEHGDLFWHRKNPSMIIRLLLGWLFKLNKSDRCQPDIYLNDGDSLLMKRCPI